MVGCDGPYTKDDFRSACALGWHVATATDYHKFGGKTVPPTAPRWVDVAWDSKGRETSLENWQGFFPISNSIYHWYDNYGLVTPLRQDESCIWVSINETCKLNFVTFDDEYARNTISNTYGCSYGCHCRGNGINGTHGVVCVKDYEGNSYLFIYISLISVFKCIRMIV